MDDVVVDQATEKFMGVAAAGRFAKARLPLLSVRSLWRRPSLRAILPFHLDALQFFAGHAMQQTQRLEARGLPRERLVLFEKPEAPGDGRPRHPQRPVHQLEAGGDKRMPLDSSVQALLSRWLGMRLPSVQIHTGPLSDLVLRRHRADAMTTGSDVLIRSDKYDLRRPAGLALLAHELTHVGQQGVPHAQTYGREERVALESERVALLDARLPLANAAAVPSARGVRPAPSVPERSARPMFAEEGRQLGLPANQPPAMGGQGLSDSQMQRFKEEVYRDLRWRIKTDFERGA